MRMPKGVLKVELQPASASLAVFDQAQNPEFFLLPIDRRKTSHWSLIYTMHVS